MASQLTGCGQFLPQLDDIADQTLFAAFFAQHHRAFPNCRMPAQCRLDLAQLYPMSADLDLRVRAAKVLNIFDPAVVAPDLQIDKAVLPVSR